MPILTEAHASAKYVYIYIYPQGMHSGSHASGFVMPSSL